MLGDALCDFTRTAGGGGGGGEEERRGGRRTPPPLPSSVALSPSPLVFSAGFRAAPSRRDGASGRVRRREGRGRRLRSGRLLHASPDRPSADVVGKPSSPHSSSHLAMCGVPTAVGPPAAPPSSFPFTPLVFEHSASAEITDAFFSLLFFFLRQDELSEFRCGVLGGRRQTPVLLCSLWLELRRLISMC